MKRICIPELVTNLRSSFLRFCNGTSQRLQEGQQFRNGSGASLLEYGERCIRHSILPSRVAA
jgi:hypothetical protein